MVAAALGCLFDLPETCPGVIAGPGPWNPAAWRANFVVDPVVHPTYN